MERCEVCQTEYEADGAEGCPTCALLNESEDAAAPQPEPRPEPAMPVAAAIPFPVAAAAARRQNRVPPPGAQAVPPQADAAPPPDKNEEPPRPMTEGERDFAAELQSLRDNKIFSIGLIGFFEGGKTWFLNRLKHEGRRRWKWSLDPGPARQGDEVKRTEHASVHRVITPQRRNFALIDVPGEWVGALVREDENNTRQQRLEASRQLIDIMTTCSALIIALPADEVLLSAGSQRRSEPEVQFDTPGADEAEIDAELKRLRAKKVADRTKKEKARITELNKLKKKATDDRNKLREDRLSVAKVDVAAFVDQILFLASLLSLVQHKGKGAKVEDISVADVRAHMTSPDFDAYHRPTFVALTKADMLSGDDATVKALAKRTGNAARLKDFDRDPLDTVRTFRDDLSAEFENCFRWHKFDFVSAFSGHRSDLKEINYGADCRGIHGVVEWIMWVADHQGRERMGKSIARARKVRMWRDGWAGEGPLPPAQEVSGA